MEKISDLLLLLLRGRSFRKSENINMIKLRSFLDTVPQYYSKKTTLIKIARQTLLCRPCCFI